ncbi:MAG: hypothetical protein ABII12_14750 [Planctomycetota bacterium]
MAMLHVDWNPTRRMLRNFGLIGLVAFGAVGAMAYWRVFLFGSLEADTGAITAYVLWALGAYCGLFAIVAPVAVKPIYVALTVVSYPIGQVVSYLVMAMIYYLVFTPIGIVFKLVGRDSMNRGFDPSAATYWVRRRPPDSAKRYFRQF